MDLYGNPFFLSDEDIDWVKRTLSRMNLKEKLGQLFCVNAKTATKDEIDYIYQILESGGLMYRSVPLENVINFGNLLRAKTRIPLLVAANLEKGGIGIVTEGTYIGSPMEIAATDDTEYAEKLGIVCAEEATAVGANWAFAPIIDLDSNFRNPITNTRTFGSDPRRVEKMALAYINAVQSRGMAASIKHFPGDGQDERDQHLVTSINDMDCETWDVTYGKIYKSCINIGAKTCMVGHIMQPAWSKRLNPEIRDEDILPGSISKEIMLGLLREHLGFNGLIVTDATTMAGFTLSMSRKKAVPLSIANGADMFLFTRNMGEDFQFMLQGIIDGVITAERLDEAVTRILALKASLGLHKKQKPIEILHAKKVIVCEQHVQWAKECAELAITLVKEEAGVLPISKEKYPRILFHLIEETGGTSLYTVKAACLKVKDALINEGFSVEVFDPCSNEEGKTPPTSDTIDSYDLILYVANLATKSNQTTLRINWAQPMGANCGHFINDIPTVFISLENPYHLLDFPRVKTFINCYSSNDYVIKALVDKLLGRSPFLGINPVDPFCGKWDAHL